MWRCHRKLMTLQLQHAFPQNFERWLNIFLNVKYCCSWKILPLFFGKTNFKAFSGRFWALKILQLFAEQSTCSRCGEICHRVFVLANFHPENTTRTTKLFRRHVVVIRLWAHDLFPGAVCCVERTPLRYAGTNHFSGKMTFESENGDWCGPRSAGSSVLWTDLTLSCQMHTVRQHQTAQSRARDLPVRRQPGSSTSGFSFATSTPVVRGDRCAPRRLELSMSPVSPCMTGSQQTVIRLLMVEETFETNFFFSSRRWSHHVYEYGNSRRDRPLFVSLPLWN